MAKNTNTGLFGGLFDFNGDGKLDMSEQYMEYKIFQECFGNDEKEDDTNTTNKKGFWG